MSCLVPFYCIKKKLREKGEKQIQQLQAEENKEATQVKGTTEKQKDSLEISDRAHLLFAQSKEEE